MIAPAQPPTPSQVARHYDELGFLYRHLWGDHLHHGLWDDLEHVGPVEEATRRLREAITAPLGLAPGQRVLDIGCGYGAPARWIAEHCGAHITGLTISHHQAAAAQSHAPPPHGQVIIEEGDWLENRYPDRAFEAAVAIESLSHMPDQAAFFRQLARTLVPGGKAAIACWMAAPDPGLIERILLKSLCRDGRLTGLGTMPEYRAFASSAGLELTGHRDLTRQVEPTWWIIARRALRSLPLDPPFLLATLRQFLRRPRFALTIPKMLLAYRTGALRYSVLWLERPPG